MRKNTIGQIRKDCDDLAVRVTYLEGMLKVFFAINALIFASIVYLAI